MVVVMVVKMRYSERGVTEEGEDVGEGKSSKAWPLNYDDFAHGNKIGNTKRKWRKNYSERDCLINKFN